MTSDRNSESEIFPAAAHLVQALNEAGVKDRQIKVLVAGEAWPRFSQAIDPSRPGVAAWVKINGILFEPVWPTQ